MHPAAFPIETLRADCDVQRTRRGGPGGQHRNKVETAIVVTHRPTGVMGQASERRSQSENLSEALFRLRVNLALQVRTPVAGDATPSALWQSRLRGERLSINPEHDDYPSLLAESLDRVADAQYDVASAASQLGCTATQLVKLLRLETRAMGLVNQERASRGQRVLK